MLISSVFSIYESGGIYSFGHWIQCETDLIRVGTDIIITTFSFYKVL